MLCKNKVHLNVQVYLYVMDELTWSFWSLYITEVKLGVFGGMFSELSLMSTVE
jgi:hypothetical protein